MADRAEVYVRNELKKDVSITCNVTVGRSDSAPVPVARGGKERIPLQSPEAFLIIHPPKEMKMEDCWVKVKSKVDLTVLCSRTNSNWTIKIDPNVSTPDVPTTVNVTVGSNGP